MTDGQTAISHRTWLKIAILAASTLAGVIAGLVAWQNLFSMSQAIAVVSIGHFDQIGSWIEEPQAAAERLRSTGFAQAVAARAGDPALAALIPARQYGGMGALGVRTLRDVNILEIKIAARQPELALNAINATVAELLANDAARMDPVVTTLTRDVKLMDELIAKASAAATSIDQHAEGLSEHGDRQGYFQALSARSAQEQAIASLMTSANGLRKMLLAMQPTRTITAPTVATPGASSRDRTAAIGGLAGFVFALLVLQLIPRFPSIPASLSRPSDAA